MGFACIPGLSLTGKTHPVAGVPHRRSWCAATQASSVLFSVTRQMSVWLTLMQETGTGATFVCVRVPAEGCKDTCPRRSATNEVWWPASDLHVNTHTHACTASRSTEERAVCLYHSSRCRRGWTPSTVVLLHIPHKHTVSNPLNSSYSDVCHTLLTTVVTYLKNACYQINKSKFKEKEKNLNVYVDFCADMTCDSSHWPENLQYNPSVPNLTDLFTANILNTYSRWITQQAWIIGL